MMFKSALCVSCVCLAAITFKVNAAIVSYSGVLNSSGSGNASIIQVSQNGTYVQVSPDFTQSIKIEVDTALPTLTYNQLSYHIDGFTMSFTDSNTTGIGQTIDIVTTLNFNEINVGLLSDIGPLSLTPTSGGLYSIQSLACPPCTNIMEDAVLSGTYSISGPTQTIDGDFSTSLPLSLGATNQAILDTSNYPSDLGISRILSPHFMFGEAGNIFNGVVDGVDVTLTNDYLIMYDISEVVLTPSIVPIPAAVWLFGSGLIGLIGIARRRLHA